MLEMLTMKTRCGIVAPLVPWIGCFSARDTSPNLTSPGTHHCIVIIVIMLSFLVLVIALLSMIMIFLITELLTQLDLSWYLFITCIVKVIMVILDLIILTSLGVETMVDSPQHQLSFPTIIAIIVILITIISIIPTMIISISPGVATMVVSILLLSHRFSPQLGLRY